MHLSASQLLQLGGYSLGHAVTSPRDLLALTALALVGVALAFLARHAATAATGSLPGRAAALREKAWSSAAFQRQLDPGAAGRPRPRAPSAVPAAA